MVKVVGQIDEVFWFLWHGLELGFAHVNATLGLAIALVAAWKMTRLHQLWVVALVASIAHLVAEILVPVLANIAPLRLPRNLLTLEYWHSALALFLGYALVISIFYGGKKVLLPRVAHSR